MHLKGCLHTHTTCSDGKLSPQEVADLYAEQGYDFIAFTDHDYLERPDRKQRYREVTSDLLLLEGVELTVFERGYLHVNRIEGHREVLHVLNHLGAYDLPLLDLMERLEALGRRYPLDAVEITNKGFRNREFEVDAIPYPKIATDDSHERSGCGRAWVEMDARRDRDSILRAIKNGDFWNCWARG